MILEHAGKRPRIDPTASIAFDATVCGAVTVGPGARVLYGARIIAEGGGEITIGRDCIVRENAVIRATQKHACRIGDSCLIGPNAHVVGATLEDEVFIATAVTILHSARLGMRAEVRPHAIVISAQIYHLEPQFPSVGWPWATPQGFCLPIIMTKSGLSRNRSTSPIGFMAFPARLRN